MGREKGEKEERHYEKQQEYGGKREKDRKCKYDVTL
jgi:hypothetical protein